MKLPLFILSLSLFLLLYCGYGPSDYDPKSDDYIPPSFTMDENTGTIQENDTIATDSISIGLRGNDGKNHHNLFRYSLDDDDWSEWEGDNEKLHLITINDIAPGEHSLKIEVCYHPDYNDNHDTTITFFRASPPKITSMSDTLRNADAGVPCTLMVQAEGTGELTYAWYRDDDGIDSETEDSLFLDTVSVEDTAHRWHCRVSSRWGDTTSPSIRLRVVFRVFYDGNGNTGGDIPDAVTTDYNDSVTIATKENLVRTGYTFIEWNAVANGSGTVYAPEAKFKMGASPVTLYAQWKNPAGMEKITAKGKTFMMEDSSGIDITLDEEPVHKVTFTYDYWMDRTEVTQGQYTSLMVATYPGFSPPSWSTAHGAGNNHPAYYVNWYDAVLYCNARTKATESSDTVYRYTSITGTPGNDCTLDGLSIDPSRSGFRLPTEAQWEYACRAGTTTHYHWGKDYNPYPSNLADSNEVDGYAVWQGNSSTKGSGNTGYGTHRVETKKKNGFGLYDMSGNVLEWCNNWYENYSSAAQTDPEGPADASERVVRGGCWTTSAKSLRSSDRHKLIPDSTVNNCGFRVCLPDR